MSISSVWNQYFNHYEPRQTEITKIKLATLNDVRKNWTREISIRIKPWKREWIQILKRSLNLRDCLSHFDWEKLILQMSLFFPFTAISSVSHPACSNGRSAEKRLFSAPYKWYHSCLSVCLLLLFHTRGSSQVPDEKKSTLWHNKQFAYVLWMSKRWWGRLYAV